jgi:putative transposase
MARKRYTAEETICHLRTVEIETGKGLGIADVYRKLGITEQTYSRWKKEYGGWRVDQVKWLKGLEQENARLKGLAADLSLDNSILNGNKTFLKRLGVSEVSPFFSMYLALRWVYIVSIDSDESWPLGKVLAQN